MSRSLVQAGALAAIGLILLAWQRYRTAIAVLLLAALWAWLCSTPAFATWLQQGLISQYPPRPAADYPQEPVIVILGGGPLSKAGDRRPDQVLVPPTTRVGFGLQLYRAGRAPVVLLSGGKDGALRLAAILRHHGVPADVIQTETRSLTTHQNALYSAAILKREGIQRILLATSGMHMPRAAASFRRQGLTVIPAPVPYVIHRIPGTRNAWWPQRQARWLTSRCFHEYFGLWGYKLLGWA